MERRPLNDRRATVRVTHLVFDFDGGGLETLVAAMARRWAGSPVTMSVVSLGGRPGRSGEAVRHLLDQFHVLRPARFVSLLFPLGVARALRQTHPDIVHLHSGAWFKGAWAARLARVPRVVYTEHGREHDDSPLSRWICRQAASLTDVVVTVSERLRGYMSGTVGIPAEHICTIVNGVDTETFQPSPDPAGPRESLGIPTDAWVIGSVGRLEPVKAYHRLVATVDQLRVAGTDRRPVHLVICGEGSQREALVAQVTAAGLSAQVHLPGWIDDPSPWYRLFDVFALTSDSEGLSVSLLEAMACGCAPVVTDVGANAHVLGAGLEGQVVPAGDVTRFTVAVAASLAAGGRRSPIAALARARVVAAFSLDRMVAEYEALYRRLLDRPEVV
jgi:glycosyltransferase involved in cell wall biosynthesis